MGEKFNYIDFLMYVLPGAYLLIILLSAALLLFPKAVGRIDNGVFTSVIFVFLCFIVGVVLQNYSNKNPQKRLKNDYWWGHFPTEIIFFKEANIVNDRARIDFIDCCVSQGFMSVEEKGLFDNLKEAKSQCFEISKNVCNEVKEHLATQNATTKLEVTLGYYLFFRGMFVASYLGIYLFAFVAIVSLTILIQWPHGLVNYLSLHPYEYSFGLSVVGMGLCCLFWRSFRMECKRVGRGYAENIQKMYCSAIKRK